MSLLCVSTAVFAIEENFDYIKPVLSDRVLVRNQDNLSTVDSNIKTLRTLIKKSENNEKVLIEEIARLQQLNEEHKELKTRYENYVTSANAEVEKFKSANKDEDAKEQDAWLADATTKINQVKAFSSKVEANMGQIKTDIETNQRELERTKSQKTKFQRELEANQLKKSQLTRTIRDTQTRSVKSTIRLPSSK